MRVLSVLLLLGCSLLGVSSQYTLDGASTFNGWVLTGIDGQNPLLNLTVGNTYTFTVSQGVNTAHPFAFSKDQNSGTPSITTLDTNLYTVTSNGCQGTGANGDGYKGTGCVISININASAAGQTIWYKCTIHPAMTGPINVLAAAPTTVTPTTVTPTTVTPTTATPTTATPTTATPTTATPTTATPTTGTATTATPTTAAPTSGPITGATLTGNSFHITGAGLTNGVPTSYIFTDGGKQYLNPTLSVAAANVTFSIEFGNPNHPFGFSTNSDTAAVAPTAAYFPDQVAGFFINSAQACNLGVAPGVKLVVANATTPATTPCVVTVPLQAADAGSIVYYRCAYHPKMLGQINVAASGTGSSTGGNKPGTASTVTGAGLALVVALMAAIMA